MSFVARHLDGVRRAVVGHGFGRRVTESWESRTGVAVEHVIGALELLLALLVFCGLGASFLTNAVGIVYPALMSIRAIESNGKDDDTEWLIYWVVFAGFCTIEYFVDYVIFWVPFFFPLKLCFLVWCFSPETRGANHIYITLVPLFRQQNKYNTEDLKR